MNAFLSIWNGIDHPRCRQGFETWQAFEHVPAIMRFPGFVDARRYRSYGNVRTRYFTLYQLTAMEALHSVEYRRLLDKPGEWAVRMAERVTDHEEVACAVSGRYGSATAVHASALRLMGLEEDLCGRLSDLLQEEVHHAELVSAQWGRVPAAERPERKVPQGSALSRGVSGTAQYVVVLDAVGHVQLRRRTRHLLKRVSAAGGYLIAKPEYFELQTYSQSINAADSPFGRELVRTDLMRRYQSQQPCSEERPGSIVLY